ncbi:metallophosphoesterase [Mycolicibacterium neworleansense]|uniref:Ser/Thr protein phosphatase n=1 Tax=Mycolicibacterium neworleansense TaxID=146018 RepID=A0A0H5RQJ0_9MYCO|nr:metallophosphoesterase [Mycolicibacterium neworleansense]MCV7365428.1 metallophosphoesterase [Mycolicibacterium neworleansense]CRZ16233.1 Ser/Thr protein phosphatase [Mycolicibacterium neworleansense]
MTDSTAQGYDIIGDVHGCATQLQALLAELGYQKASNTSEYRHPERQAIFVGDLIDRGDEQLQALQIVKDMVEAGSAKIVMGNHEFNALAYDTEWPVGSGQYLRPRSAKNAKQHAAFLAQVTGADRRRYLDWFTTIPLWLDLGGLRVVHACWHPDSIAAVEKHCGSSTPFRDIAHLVAATDKAHPLYQAIETLLKGPEISLVDRDQPEYHDKDGHPRANARIRWWHSEARTLRDIAEMGGNFTTPTGEPYPLLPELELSDRDHTYVYPPGVPVFYGHYWRQRPAQRLHDWTDYTACVDFSAVKGGALTAYRWSGETRIDPANYVPLVS